MVFVSDSPQLIVEPSELLPGAPATYVTIPPASNATLPLNGYYFAQGCDDALRGMPIQQQVRKHPVPCNSSRWHVYRDSGDVIALFRQRA
jgi:hypothetical protein